MKYDSISRGIGQLLQIFSPKEDTIFVLQIYHETVEFSNTDPLGILSVNNKMFL